MPSILTHKTTISDNIGTEDCGEFAFEAFGVHRIPSKKTKTSEGSKVYPVKSAGGGYCEAGV